MPSETRRADVALVLGRDHVDVVVEAVRSARTSVWIATANLKDVHVTARIGTRARAAGRFESLFEELGELRRRGVDVRLLSAGEPSRALRPKVGVKAGPELRRCPRVHLKMIAIDGATLYLGSANFTGAGLGAKADGRRNFEAGILTSDDVLLDVMQGEFDAIWSGRRCANCKLRKECPAPLDLLVRGCRQPLPPSEQLQAGPPRRAPWTEPPTVLVPLARDEKVRRGLPPATLRAGPQPRLPTTQDPTRAARIRRAKPPETETAPRSSPTPRRRGPKP
jgi:phosphatidylserine/phosphatidylglycerophosphate/cardiolipin synthase-like enzyme